MDLFSAAPAFACSASIGEIAHVQEEKEELLVELAKRAIREDRQML